MTGHRRLVERVFLGVLCSGLVLVAACGRSQPVLLQILEARRLAAELHAAFVKANEASDRAVLADTDDVSAEAAGEARAATRVATETLDRLEQVVKALGASSDVEAVARFRTQFDLFRALDEEVLGLAVENTNLKAQRLSFGTVRDLGEAIERELAGLSGTPPSSDVDAQVQGIRADVFALLFLESRHIAEAEDQPMTQLEAEGGTIAADVRTRLERVRRLGAPVPTVDAATSLFNRFMATHAEVIALSRRNTNVRSLALTIGHKRVVASACEAELTALAQSLATHGSEATR
ncbi:MAG: hypothetical protein JSU08_17875 [Acidobacteria bacterium]|nr:hypothetical protein [Acidobacteriota bacterium]